MARNQLAPVRKEPYFYHAVGDIKMVHGDGLYLYAKDDETPYLDCASGTFNLPFGHNPANVIAAAKQQLDRLAYISSSFHSDPVDELAKLITELTPDNLTSVHLRSPGGSTANEGAIRIAQYATGKSDVIGLFRGHMGQTIATTAASGYAARRAPFPNTSSGFLHVPAPYCYRCFYNSVAEECGFACVDRISDFIRYASSGNVAAIMVEPVMATGGTIVPPKGYFEELKQFCEDQDIILIFDEVQTGFGRCGTMFAADHFGVSPHIMTLAKGISGIGMPIGAIVTEARLEGLERLYHGFTNGGHVVSAAAAVETIKMLSAPGFLQRVARQGEKLKAGLEQVVARFQWLADARGVGMMLGFECVYPDTGAADNTRALKLQKEMLQQRVITRVSEYSQGNAIEIRPPLTLSDEEIDLVLRKIETACQNVT
ncbi:MAG: aspartate aminotransferase family protein [Pseudomonadota bacterium]